MGPLDGRGDDAHVRGVAQRGREREADGEALAGLVLDSPFSDFTTLAEEQVQRARDSGVTAPGMLVSLLMSYLADAVKESAGFDPRDLRPIDGAERATKPALFIVARDDRFVTPSHGRGIHEKYGADKGLLLVRGSHNTPRPAGLVPEGRERLPPVTRAAQAATPAWAHRH